MFKKVFFSEAQVVDRGALLKGELSGYKIESLTVNNSG
jgi:hypothetical protein